MIFAMLCSPGLENAPFREIARAATVALGSVSVVMNDLRQTGYLADMGTRGRPRINTPQSMHIPRTNSRIRPGVRAFGE